MVAAIAKNAPCPCGSGKKYKNCCLPKEGPAKVTVPPGRGEGRPASATHSGRFTLLLILAVIAVGSVIYSNTLHAPFTFDDAIIEQQRAGQRVKVSLKSLVNWQRPVSYLSFHLNYAWGGDDPFVYHLTSISIHLLTAIILYFLIYTTLSLPLLRDRYGGVSQRVAAIAALLFVSHPVQVQAVTYIVQRMTSLGAMFYLLSLLAYARGRMAAGGKRIALYIGSVLAALLAFGSKQHTVTLPIVIILYEFFFFQGLDFKRFKKRLAFFASSLILPLVIGVFYLQDMGWLLRGYDQYKFTIGEKALTEFRVLIYYISLLIFPLPSRLNLDYDYSLSRSLFSPPTTFICLLILIGLLVFAFRLTKKKPLFAFSIFWFLGHLALEAFLLPIEIIYEHRLYLPSVGFFIIVAVVLVKLFERMAKKNRLPAELAVVALLVVLLGWGTYQRNEVWGSEISLWSDVVKKSPNKARPHNNLGKAYATAGLAEKNPAKAMELGNKAIEEYKQAVRLNPLNYVAFDNLGQAYGRRGMTDEAIRACRESARLKPDYLPAHNNLGVAYNKKKKYEEAIDHCLKALEINPRYAKAYFNLGRGYDGKSEYNKAVEAFKKAFELKPDDANIPYNIGNSYFNRGLNDKAIEFYRQTLKMKPDFLNAYYNLGVIYFNQGNYKAAVEQYRKILEIRPGHVSAHERLGLLYMNKLKNYKLALFNFKKVVELSGNKREARLARESIKKLEQKGVSLGE